MRRTYEEGWRSAIRLYRYLAEGGPLVTSPDPPVPLADGEVDLAEATLQYSRFYGDPAAGDASRWRDERFVFAIVTDRRLLCDLQREWLAFWYGGITRVTFHPDEWAFELEFTDAAPMRLQGPMAPAFCLLVMYLDHGLTSLGLDLFAELAAGAPPPRISV